MPTQQSIVFIPDLELMALHQIDMSRLQQTLTSLLNENQILTLMDQRHPMPVKFGSQSMSVEDILATGMVVNRLGVEIPLGLMLTPQRSETVQTIVAGLDGPYHPLKANMASRDVPLSIEIVREGLRKGDAFEAYFTGSYFAQKALGKELLVIGLVALMLLFFILAAQFESLRLPLIVLIEVPLALTGALFFLYIAGDSLNIMSMIGMVVMAGIIINDSILKVDTINRLRAGGMGLIRALYTAGHYRLRPILMTSITTICALLPFLFIGGLGGDLQRPLALAVMGGLGLGTLISLYFIPVCYYLLFRNSK